MTQGPIIVRKMAGRHRKKHGGAWKVAYADFVTAMMAFFLLLWLLNAATREQLEGISNYFAPISTRLQTSGGGGFLGGRFAAEKGASDLDTRLPEPVREAAAVVTPGVTPPPSLDAREEQQLAAAEKALREAVRLMPQAEQLAKSLLIDNTPEGLRIQIADQEGLPMFPRGEAGMYAHTLDLVRMVAQVVLEMPQAISISGHTDAMPYVPAAGYSNWELSADRANAVRRALVESGVPADRIARVVGKAATEPLLRDDPKAPGNRRMSVVLLREAKISR